MTAVGAMNRFSHCQKITANHLIIKTDSFYTKIQNIFIVSCCYGTGLVFHDCSRRMQWHQFTQSLYKFFTLLDVVWTCFTIKMFYSFCYYKAAGGQQVHALQQGILKTIII